KSEELNKIDPVELAQIAQSAYEHHAPKLMWFCRESSVPNQRSIGLTALAYITEIFAESKHAPQVKQYMTDQWDDMLKGNYLPDGGNLEHSFNYNQQEIRELDGLSKFYGKKLPDSLKRIESTIKARKAVDDGLRTPLGGLPQVGNNQDVLGQNVWVNSETGKKYWELTKVRGRSPLRPQTYTSIAFPYSGFYVMRGGWELKSPYLFFMNGRPQRGHSMRDNLAIQLTAFGRQFLVCSGPPTYGFNSNIPDAKGARHYLSEESGFKNNTVIVDGKAQARNTKIATRAPLTPVKSRWHTSSRFDYVDGCYDLGYTDTRNKKAPVDMNVKHERSVIFVKSVPLWIIYDNMINTDKKERKYTQIWNFPPLINDGNNVAGFNDAQIVYDCASKKCGTADTDGPNLDMYHFGPEKIDYKRYHGDRENWLGWYSRKIGEAVPAPDLHVNWQSGDSKGLLTLLVPRDKDAKNPIRSISPEGNNGFIATLINGAKLEVTASSRKLLVKYQNGKEICGIAKGVESLSIENEKINSSKECFEFSRGDNETFKIIDIVIPGKQILKTSNTDKPELRAADLKDAKGLTPGLLCRYAEYNNKARLFDIMKKAETAPLETFIAKNHSPEKFQGRQRYGLLFTGYLEVEKDGIYTFELNSPNADAALFIYNPDQELMGPPLVFTDYRSSQSIASTGLKKGLHCIRIEYKHHLGKQKDLSIIIDGKFPLQEMKLYYTPTLNKKSSL
ncbi:MAG: heparinase II/III family protein, partial [Victivallales bacterium]|nr:heparinase II/III family protein [Victivallales bacterium]